MKALVTGSRKWRNAQLIENELVALVQNGGDDSELIVVHGGADGADTLADCIARSLLRCEVRPYPVDWNGAKRVLGKRWRMAGMLRNQWMLDAEEPDLVLGFAMPDSRGTIDMMKRARAAGVPWVFWKYDDRGVPRRYAPFSKGEGK